VWQVVVSRHDEKNDAREAKEHCPLIAMLYNYYLYINIIIKRIGMEILTVNMPMGSNKNELKKLVKNVMCNVLKFSEINVIFSYRTDKFS
jgi:hypothetical protein